MKRILMSVMAVLLLTGLSFAQKAQVPKNWQKKTARALKIGDQMPGYTFPSVSQYGKSTLDLNDFKGKLIIIDFWFTGCTSCFDFFPHLQQLQDQFKDQVRVIAANDLFSDNWVKINKSMERFKKATGYKFDVPIALYDSTFYDYFPHISPCEIIIDPAGKVVAITNFEDVTKENIQAVLNGKNVSFGVHNDFWNANIPYVSAFNKENKKGIFISSSLIKARALPGEAPWGSQHNDKGQYTGVRTIFSLIEGYRDAHPALFAGTDQVEYETKDEIFKEYKNYPDSNRFIYDLIVQPGIYKDNSTEVFYQNSLRSDLDRAFNFSLRRSKKEYPCLVIKVNKNISKSFSKRPASEEPDNNIFKYKTATKNHIPVFAHKVHIDFLDEIKSEFKAVKIIDETSLGKQNLDIDFPVGLDFTNTEKLIAFLATKGIDITVENRELDCVIVSDKKPGEPTILSN